MLLSFPTCLSLPSLLRSCPTWSGGLLFFLLLSSLFGCPTLAPNSEPFEQPQDASPPTEKPLEASKELPPEIEATTEKVYPEPHNEAFPEPSPLPPLLERLSPEKSSANKPLTLLLEGKHFAARAKVLFKPASSPQPSTVRVLSSTRIEADIPALLGGSYQVSLRNPDGQESAALTLVIANSPPRFLDPGPQKIPEEQGWSLTIQVVDDDNQSPRVYALQMPPGGQWDAEKKTFSFRPDFTQGGKTYTLLMMADDGQDQTQQHISITVEDTIQPPAPVVSQREAKADHERLRVEQTTDSFLDSKGYAGRTFQAHISIPQVPAGRRLPVRIQLHGFDDTPQAAGDGSEFLIIPHDPMNTYWWGYAESLPQQSPSNGSLVPPYTQRRVLHLLSWVLKTYPHADPERVYVQGVSMGGAGAKTLGLLHGRHFCYVEATIGQAIPRNHRPLRLTQLASLWGQPDQQTLSDTGSLLWNHLDITRILREIPEATHQFIFTKHSKDDDTIHFGAAVMASPLTRLSLYEAFQALHIGHYAVWDEGGHGSADPVLGDFWSDWGWHRVKDATTFLRRDLAFPAFSRSSADQDPGNGQGNGKHPWDPNKGFAGIVSIPQDTGWDGDIAGARNRHLRWDSTQILDTFERFSISLKILDAQGEAPPRPSYPSRGNRYDGPLPLHVDVTPRRLQNFQTLPQETIRYTFGQKSGTVKADATGSITIPQLSITKDWQTLTLQREAP